MTSRTTRLAAALLAACITAAAPAQTVPRNMPQKLDAIRLNAGMIVIRAELAQTQAEREIGMMFRNTVGANEGMLFAFENAGTQCFWMKNTLLPLSIAFLADDGSVVNVDAMAAQTLASHCSAKPVRYVLEMPDGWFARHGVKPGSRIQGGPFGR